MQFGMTAERNVFATPRGKVIVMGLGGTIKRLAARASLQRTTPIISFRRESHPSAKFHFATT